MKYFISGICGFVASNFVNKLLSTNDDIKIVGVDNLSVGKVEFLENVLSDPRLKIIIADIKDLTFLTRHMNGADIVIHTASNADISKAVTQPDIDFWEGNYLTLNILESMRINNIKKIFFPSGSGCYGEPEDKNQLLKENVYYSHPSSPYGASKLSSEALITSYCNMFNIEALIFRCANIVGKSQTHGVGFSFINKLKQNNGYLKILGDGLQQKGYIHINDVINAILLGLARNNKNSYNIYNVANDDQITVNGIADIVIREMGLKNVKISYTGGDRGWRGDIPVVKLDNTKIKTELGWNYQYNSREAITKSVKEMLGKE